jgi:hypothetical protein
VLIFTIYGGILNRIAELTISLGNFIKLTRWALGSQVILALKVGKFLVSLAFVVSSYLTIACLAIAGTYLAIACLAIAGTYLAIVVTYLAIAVTCLAIVGTYLAAASLADYIVDS